MASHNEKRMRLRGVVVSDRMDKTVTVKVERLVQHPRFRKYVKRSKKYLAHDERRQCSVGDTVEIIQTRPLSKQKSWAVTRILVKAE